MSTIAAAYVARRGASGFVASHSSRFFSGVRFNLNVPRRCFFALNLGGFFGLRSPRFSLQLADELSNCFVTPFRRVCKVDFRPSSHVRGE